MVSCGVSRETAVVSVNPDLNRYLSANPDSANCLKEYPAEPGSWQNDALLHEKVNPEKEASWADIFHNIVEYFWPR